MSIALEPSSVDATPTVMTRELTIGPGAGTAALWAWECPRCGASYDAELDVCLEDGTPLRKVELSLPFIWIG